MGVPNTSISRSNNRRSCGRGSHKLAHNAFQCQKMGSVGHQFMGSIFPKRRLSDSFLLCLAVRKMLLSIFLKVAGNGTSNLRDRESDTDPEILQSDECTHAVLRACASGRNEKILPRTSRRSQLRMEDRTGDATVLVNPGKFLLGNIWR